MRADEHVHERALAHSQSERIVEQPAQPLVGKRLEAFEIDRQRMNARPERRRCRNRWRWPFRRRAAMHAPARETPVADHVGLDRRDLDLVVFPNQLSFRARRERPAARFADARRMIPELVGIVRQTTVVRLVAGLRATGPGILPRFLLVGRRRLGRRSRILVGTLKPQHQVYQLLFAELLQISSIHPSMDSEFESERKGVGNCRRAARLHSPGRYHALSPDPIASDQAAPASARAPGPRRIPPIASRSCVRRRQSTPREEDRSAVAVPRDETGRQCDPSMRQGLRTRATPRQTNPKPPSVPPTRFIHGGYSVTASSTTVVLERRENPLAAPALSRMTNARTSSGDWRAAHPSRPWRANTSQAVKPSCERATPRRLDIYSIGSRLCQG